MKELNLLVENYFSPALGATDILRLVEQIMNETPMIVSEAQEDIDVKKDMTIDDSIGKSQHKSERHGDKSRADRVQTDRAVGSKTMLLRWELSNSNRSRFDVQELSESHSNSCRRPREGESENKCSLDEVSICYSNIEHNV